MKNKLLIFPVLLLFFVLSVFFYLLIIERNPNELPSTLLNKNVPIFKADSLLNEEKFISEEKFKNEITLVNFFATWCGPCREEHVFIERFSKEKKIKVYGINYKDKPKKSIRWLQEMGNPYSDIAVDIDGRIAIDWGVYGIPETFIINSSGIIIYRHVGPITKITYRKINSLINKNK